MIIEEEETETWSEEDIATHLTWCVGSWHPIGGADPERILEMATRHGWAIRVTPLGLAVANFGNVGYKANAEEVM